MKTISILMNVLFVILVGCARHEEPKRIDSTSHGPDLLWTNPTWSIELNETNVPDNNRHFIEVSPTVDPMDRVMTEEKTDVSRMGLIYDVQK